MIIPIVRGGRGLKNVDKYHNIFSLEIVMNAIKQPPEPMGEDLECYSIVVINLLSVTDVEAYL